MLYSMILSGGVSACLGASLDESVSVFFVASCWSLAYLFKA